MLKLCEAGAKVFVYRWRKGLCLFFVRSLLSKRSFDIRLWSLLATLRSARGASLRVSSQKTNIVLFSSKSVADFSSDLQVILLTLVYIISQILFLMLFR